MTLVNYKTHYEAVKVHHLALSNTTTHYVHNSFYIFQIAGCLSSIFLVISASGNLIIYLNSNQTFRQVMVQFYLHFDFHDQQMTSRYTTTSRKTSNTSLHKCSTMSKPDAIELQRLQERPE